jgi:transposase InsO family protein
MDTTGGRPAAAARAARRAVVGQPGVGRYAVLLMGTAVTTGCGSSTSPTCRSGPARCSPRSSPTCSPGGSSAGAPRRRCRPGCRWTPWRWLCGPAARPGRRSAASFTTAMRASSHLDPLRHPAPRRRRAGLDRVGRGQLRQRPGRERHRPLKTECVRHDRPWRGVDDLGLATLGWVHWFNQTRLHSSIGHVPPIKYETAYYRHIDPQQQPLPGALSLH